MNSQQLLYINLGIGLFFVLYFLFFRSKPRPPVRLNLRAKSSEEHQKESDFFQSDKLKADSAKVVQEVLAANPLAAFSKSEEVEATEQPYAVAQTALKENSIYFIYNAHEWECHDVLGISRGASLSEATVKYQQLIKTSDPSAFPFYEAAFEAILKRKRDGAK